MKLSKKIIEGIVIDRETGFLFLSDSC